VAARGRPEWAAFYFRCLSNAGQVPSTTPLLRHPLSSPRSPTTGGAGPRGRILTRPWQSSGVNRRSSIACRAPGGGERGAGGAWGSPRWGLGPDILWARRSGRDPWPAVPAAYIGITLPASGRTQTSDKKIEPGFLPASYT
jgi:hypothetical protein